MGAWGIKLYQNDIGSEIKDNYIQKRKAGKTTEEALQEVLEENASYFDDEDDKYDSWFALADTLWKHGVLPEEVKKKALELIEEEPQERWETEKQWKAREKVLVDLKQQLLSEMPPVKKVSVHKPYVTNWKPQEVYLYQIKNPPQECQQYQGWYVAIYVHEIRGHSFVVREIKDMTPYVYLKMSKVKPEKISDLEKMIFLTWNWDKKTGQAQYGFSFMDVSDRKMPKDLEYLGICENFIYPTCEKITEDSLGGMVSWQSFEHDTARWYNSSKWILEYNKKLDQITGVTLEERVKLEEKVMREWKENKKIPRKQRMALDVKSATDHPVHNSFESPWYVCGAFLYEIANPPKGKEQYRGWYLLIYSYQNRGVESVVSEVYDIVADIYVKVLKGQSELAMGAMNYLPFCCFSENEKTGQGRYRVTFNAVSNEAYPQQIEDLGMRFDFMEPDEEEIQEVPLQISDWETLVEKSIEGYEREMERKHFGCHSLE